ncbi:SDR family NAD(P)-dependent oxidoreductase [Xylanimonas sp. McL0601]|uniref:SDR family NAD(P)-dependent oxidoreductase n=1 Tax=Xylanimonas sp. McL0601 TaxID=3414739 RepID=UPI003CF8DF72
MKTIIVTGASDGIGAAAAQQLAAEGHRVVVVGRSPEKTEAVARRIGTEAFLHADFARLDDVRRLAADLRHLCPRIDVLANNAGGMFDGPVATVDGFERTFQVNHLAPFLLTHLLLDVLIDSGASVIATSSMGARGLSRIDADDLQTWHGFTTPRAYGNAKLANILFTKALHERYHARGLSAVAFHPGVIATNFASETRNWMRIGYHTPARRLFASPARGGSNLVFFADGTPGRDWVPGAFYDQRRLSSSSPQADDEALVRAHWEQSAKLLGLPV